MVSSESKVLIVGAGCFGISTAYHLLKRGFTDITVIDRSEVLPAVDAASNDFNRIVRTAYVDEFYSKLAKEAIESWKKDATELWDNAYHESGVLLLGQSSAEGTYVHEAYENDARQGLRVRKLDTDHAVAELSKEMLGSQVIVDFRGMTGYLNHDSGWADAGRATAALISRVKALGGKIIGGKTVKELIHKDGLTHGVKCTDGSSIHADLVVLATGSWTPSAFTSLGLEGKCLASGQCVAMIQLTEEEADAYREGPVTLNFDTGFYCFPPTEKGILKMAFHRAGFTHTVGQVSTPRTLASDPNNGLSIPKEVVKDFRETLRTMYPDLAKKPFSSTRLCWYNDTPDSDWVIGRHSKDQNLILATGDSGHAFKVGRIVADAIQEALDPKIARKFALDRSIEHGDLSRKGMVAKELVLNQLSVPEDLGATA
ncbi:hypothetical protein PQX77_006409 [Marasmius sp. AFHP31]|nr:hypothetical protein PQX77_006409 [Marasmius sp. AFHP31]